MHGVLRDLLIVLGISLVAVFALRRAGIPAIVGFLVAGVVIGPGGLRLIREVHSIEMLAEVGVVLLLFTIGLKFSLAELNRMRSYVFGAGTLQVVGTIGASVLIGSLLGLDLPKALFLGFLLAMSSTAIVLKLLEERAETEGPQGRFVTGILVFQDLAVVPLTLLVPLLGGESMSVAQAAWTLGKSLLLVVAIIVAARVVFPRLLELVARTRNREVFTITTILAVIGTAYACSEIGLSLALGAFIAGVVISESDYSQQILSEFVPLRDVFAGLFFVSVGMLVDLSKWTDDPHLIVGLTAAVIALKGVVVWVVARAFGTGARVALIAGLALAQVGEFSFVLAKDGAALGLMDDRTNQLFLSVSVLSMALTPFAIMLTPWIIGRAAGPREHHEPTTELRDHVVIVGFGVAGRNVAHVLKHLGLRYLILELNPHTVRKLQAEGHEVQYGDACRQEVLERAGVAHARSLVLTVPEAVSARATVALARRLHPKLDIVVRTRFLSEIEQLYALGASEVVPEELEASLQLAARVMARYGVSQHAIARQQASMRSEHYAVLLGTSAPDATAADLNKILAASEVEQVRVDERSPLAGRTLADTRFRAETGASILAVTRDGRVTPNPPADYRLDAGDVVWLLGTTAEIAAARQRLGPA